MSGAGRSWGVMFIVAVGLWGCASDRTPHPTGAIEAYKAAVEDRDAAEVWGLLDESARMGLDEDGFAAYFEQHYDAIRDQSRRLARRVEVDGALQIEAQVPVAGSVAPVVWVEGGWFLGRESPTRSSQDTPRDTLEALLRALAARDLEGAMTLLSHERRTVYIQEMDALASGLGGSIDNAIVTDGDSAVLPLDNGDRVLLIREDGVWKLQGYEQAED